MFQLKTGLDSGTQDSDAGDLRRGKRQGCKSTCSRGSNIGEVTFVEKGRT